MKVYVPGKIILSGEHAVLYGQPALAMAVNRYAMATVTQEILPQISFHLADLAHRSRLSIAGLKHFQERVKRKYQRFVRGEYTIRQVLRKPFELAQFALGMFAEAANISLPHGMAIEVQSDIPIGCGMGSSAATILCVMQAISTHLNMTITPDMLYRFALQAENVQHGQSSGLDLRVAMRGGCLYIHGDEVQSRAMPLLSMHLVHTGKPQTTTGECVVKAAPYFKSHQLADRFRAVTDAMDVALQQQSWGDTQATIRQNHQLLTEIGVVPDKVQQFIAATEAVGGATKVCGAGAVAGDAAGMLLTLTEDTAQLTALCAQFGYTLIPIQGESRGVHAV